MDTGDYALNITISNMTYSIPLRNFLADTQYYESRHDCDLFIAQLYYKFENAIRLGDPFLSAFLPVFDVDNDMLGLAVAARALPGTAMNPGSATPAPTTPTPPTEKKKSTAEAVFDFISTSEEVFEKMLQ